MAPRAIRGARDFIDEPGYLPEDLKAISFCYHRPPVICATLNPCSTSDELTGIVAKMCFAMFSCFELQSKISWNRLEVFSLSTFRQLIHFYSNAACRQLFKRTSIAICEPDYL